MRIDFGGGLRWWPSHVSRRLKTQAAQHLIAAICSGGSNCVISTDFMRKEPKRTAHSIDRRVSTNAPGLPRATVSWPYSTDRGVITVAQKVQVILTDDLDGGDAEETVQFAIDGVSYEIDLSAANAEALREAVAAYVEAGRRIGGRSTRRAAAAPKGRPAAERADLADVRAWARDNGFQVSDRGRVSGEVRAAYEAAH